MHEILGQPETYYFLRHTTIQIEETGSGKYKIHVQAKGGKYDFYADDKEAACEKASSVFRDGIWSKYYGDPEVGYIHACVRPQFIRSVRITKVPKRKEDE